jgi:DNA repair photolyase
MADQLILFDELRLVKQQEYAAKPNVCFLEKSKVLARAHGFMDDYDYTLNPYIGCQFGCAYCYAAFFINSTEKRRDWGLWVDVKTNAMKELNTRRSLYDKKIYMSSVTDPYQPIESKLELTRGILEILSAPSKMPRLVIQTRSPLVTRDIDILRRFKHLRVNMTITTDSDAIRKRFEPYCPSNDHRLEAISTVKSAGIKISICITPMLPLKNPEAFARQLASLQADIYVAQPFKPSQGPFAASTRSMAVAIAKEYGWTEKEYRKAFDILREYLPHLYEGKEGFVPE